MSAFGLHPGERLTEQQTEQLEQSYEIGTPRRFVDVVYRRRELNDLGLVDGHREEERRAILLSKIRSLDFQAFVKQTFGMLWL